MTDAPNKPLPSQRKLPRWFKILSGIAIIGIILSVLGLLLSESMLEVVEEQLQTLREGGVTKAYYEYTSEAFQKTTSLEAFRDFLALYPALSNNKTFIFEEKWIRENIGIVKGTLVSQSLQEMAAEWQLVKENGQWKILSLKLTELLKQDQKDSLLTKMVDEVQLQLGSIRQNDLIDAYYSYSSQDFQKETSLSDFETFIRDNAIFFNYKSLEVKDARIVNDKGFVQLLLGSDSSEYIVEYKLSKEAGDWKVFSVRIELPAEVAVKQAVTNPEALIPPVRTFLDSLASGKSFEAYRETAKGFQETTSFKDFQHFLNVNPMFSKRDFADIKNGVIENKVGKLRVNLHDQQGMTIVEFRLAFNEGRWEVWGMDVVEKPAEPLTPIVERKIPPLADQLIHLVYELQAALHHQDYFEAYTELMSGRYQRKHSVDDFGQFLSVNQPFLDTRSSYFNRIEQQGEKAILRGSITVIGGKSYPVRFHFVKEEGGWKIHDFTLLEAHEPIAASEEVLDKPFDSPPLAPQITDLSVGTDINEKGVILSPTNTILSDTQMIFFNVHLNRVMAHSMVTLFLEHVDSGSSAPSLSTMVENEGTSIITFSYIMPKNGWPPGEYIVKVTLSTGQERIEKFTVVIPKTMPE